MLTAFYKNFISHIQQCYSVCLSKTIRQGEKGLDKTD